MADITIPQLNAATSVSGTDVMVISQAGVTKKVEVDKLTEKVLSSSVKLVQTTGTDANVAMSQKSITDLLNGIKSSEKLISRTLSYGSVNIIDPSKFLKDTSVNFDNGLFVKHIGWHITGYQEVEENKKYVFKSGEIPYYYFIYKYDKDYQYLGAVVVPGGESFTCPVGCKYAVRMSDVDRTDIDFFDFVYYSMLAESDIDIAFKPLMLLPKYDDIYKISSLLQLPYNVVDKAAFIGVFDNDIEQGSEAFNLLPFGGKISFWDWGTGMYGDITNFPYYVNNTEIDWNYRISYSELLRNDYNTVLVKYKAESPNDIELILIFKSGYHLSLFTELEQDAVVKSLKLPMYRSGYLDFNGEFKSNRGLKQNPVPVELLANNKFKTTDAWQLGATWNIDTANGLAKCNDTQPALSSMLQNPATAMIVGEKYKIIYEVANYVSGRIQVLVDWDTHVGNPIAGNTLVEETFTYTRIGTHANEIMFRPAGMGFVGDIKRVSLIRLKP